MPNIIIGKEGVFQNGFSNNVNKNAVLWYDAGDNSSYPDSGSTVTDLSSSGIDGTLNGPVYNTSPERFNFSANGDIQTNNFSLGFGLTESFSLMAWINTSNVAQQGKIINMGQSNAFPKILMILSFLVAI